ncbi:MAG: DeoR/GlpR family DNA-binding transcription regulator [Nocardioidaceae bacterium]
MFATDRRRAILDLVRQNGVMSLHDLALAVDSSEVTVRRDIQMLDSDGLVDRRRGGAAWPGGLSHEQSYRQKTLVAAAEKATIADLAAELVEEGDAVVIGAGTTTEEFTRRLLRLRDLTVVTNSLLVAQVLARSAAEVVMTGGSLRGTTYALVGGAAEHSFSQLRVRRAFLSGNGLTVVRGLSTPNPHAAGVDQAIASAAQEVVVLADHTKLGVDTMFQTVPTSRITHLVTDAYGNADLLGEFAAAGVQVHTAARVATA